MNLFWTLSLVVFTQKSLSIPNCTDLSKICECIPRSPLELHCQANNTNPPYVLHIDENTTEIDCSDKTLQLEVLPKFPPEKRYRLEMISCPPPLGDFKQICDYFSMSNISTLQFEYSENVIFTKESFDGLKLERLKLTDIKFERIDKNTFNVIPNLLYLEIEATTNLILEKTVFHNLTKLEHLYLTTNNLTDFPDGLFGSLVSLHTLHLWNNQLTVLKNNTFTNLLKLKSLDLHGNKLEKICSGAFRTLKKLTSVNLSQNLLTTLPVDLFRNNRVLQKIILHDNTKLQLPDYLFADMKLLQRVDISMCNFNSLHENIFANCSNLTFIDLSHNHLEDIPPALFRGLKQLKTLHLQHNKLGVIRPEASDDLSSLEKLYLNVNMIKTVDDETFVNKKNLVVVNLAHNFIRSIDWQDADNLETVDLTNNSIEHIGDVFIVYNQLKLKELLLNGNSIKELTLNDLQPVGRNLHVSLHNNNITSIKLHNLDEIQGDGNTKISLSSNPLRCDCDFYKFLLFMKLGEPKNAAKQYDFKGLVCGSPQNLDQTEVTNIGLNEFRCDFPRARGCPPKCDCTYGPHDKLVVMNCSRRSLVDYPHIDSNIPATVELYLDGNLLHSGPDKSEGYAKVTKLFLSSNKIGRLGWLPPKLKVLHLDSNELASLDFGVIDFLKNSSLVILTLDNNPWRCDCLAVNLTNFLREHPHMVKPQKVHCVHNNKPLVHMTEPDLCLNNLILVGLPTVICLLVFMTLLVLFYRFNEEVKIWLFSHNLCLTCVTEEDLDKSKPYDVFISYSHNDEDFVTQHLVPNLESGPHPYKLCLHFRNWIPGEFISTQVTNSVIESRRTLVVLSPNFLESVWARLEFRTAHSRAMTDGRARVVIVLYGDVHVDKLDDELKAYLKTNTYIKWGDHYFWNRLRYALPHKKFGAPRRMHTLPGERSQEEEAIC